MLQAETILLYMILGLYFAAMALYFAFLAAKKPFLGKLAAWTQLAGLLVHSAALVVRGIGAGRLPLTNQYEFAACFAWALCLVCLIFVRRFRYTILGVFSAPL